ncbi:MAG: hypothetical protein ACOZQL_07780 [Myxococcota bacterium]
MTPNKKPRKTSPSWRDALRILLVLAALLTVLREGATTEQLLRLLEVVL